MRSRVGAACLALVVAAALLWGSSRVTWVQVSASDDLRGTRSAALAGSTWAAGTVPLALALLAAVAAVLAVRGWARRAVALLVALVAVGACVPAVGLLSQGPDTATAAGLLDPPVRPATAAASTAAAGPALALLGAAVAVLAAVLLLRVERTRGGLSSRYAAPRARREQAREQVTGTGTRGAAKTVAGAGAGLPADDPAAAALTERVLWDALDAGEDPTAGPEPAWGGGTAGGPGGGGDPHHPAATLEGGRGTADDGGQQGGPGAR